MDVILVACPVCDGAGEWDEGPYGSRWAIEPDYRQVFCPECEGTGQAFVPAEPATLDDLMEQDAEQNPAK